MTQWTPEEWTRVQTSGLDALAGVSTTIGGSAEKVTALNCRAARTVLEQTRNGVVKALSAQKPDEIVKCQMEAFHLAIESVSDYWRQRWDIISATQAECVRVYEAQCKVMMDEMQSAINSTGKRAPSDSPSPLAAWEGAVGATTALYESMQSMAKQAMEVAGSGFGTAAAPAMKAAHRRASPGAVPR